MNINQALELSSKSIPKFEKKLKKIKLNEGYELVDNLRFTNNPEVFRTAYNLLKQHLIFYYKQLTKMQNKHKKEDFKNISLFFAFERFHAFYMTGFEIFNAQGPKFNYTILPSDFFKNLIDKVSTWEK